MAGQSRLETLPYEIRAIIFEHLGYTFVYFPTVSINLQTRDVHYGFKTPAIQQGAYACRYGQKSKIVGLQYEQYEVWPSTTTVKLPGTKYLAHLQGSGFNPFVMWISRTLRDGALELLYRGVTRLRNPNRGVVNSLTFIERQCPQLASLSITMHQLALFRAQQRHLQELVAAIVGVAQKCESLREMKLGLREFAYLQPVHWADDTEFSKLELGDVADNYRLRVVETWVGEELGKLASTKSRVRFLVEKGRAWD
ncbi:hypothetical protein CC86DRAFT_342767 [Ophiobolus disseminans]|uniref:Uncharacterized protein n=1 Tax=Ophiobolus disseminans TaxID=1469910 RepID=A0A6A7AGA9_9PLEO|nr:hypothetical protein CC86DRAFT_342767 [Ophiobolus disseminans]